LKEAADVFRRVFFSDSRICLYEMAVGRDVMEMPIHVSKADDSSSLLPITTLQNDLFPGTAEKTIRAVQVKSLSSVLSKDEIIFPALLKMDVQGYEKEALQGCQPLLDSFLYIYVECSFVELYAGQALASEVISYLDQSGFGLCGIYNLSYDKKGRAIQGDFLFTKDLDRHNRCVS
jgi:FkbM family methyltransferase